LNIFSEVFHWILEQQLTIAKIPATIIHYIDDFSIVFPPEGSNNLHQCRNLFSTVSSQVGLIIKASKNEEGKTESFTGLEFETEGMVIDLTEKKLQKAGAMIHEVHKTRSLSVLDIQKVTGYLNLISNVVLLERTFLHSLYNMELYFPSYAARHQKGRIYLERHIRI